MEVIWNMCVDVIASLFDINISRSLWRSYSRQSDLMMFVVDLEDRERLDEAKLEMGRMVRILGKSVPIMVLANKMDLPGGMKYTVIQNYLFKLFPGTISETSLTKFLGLSDSEPGLWTVRECCAVTGEGLENVLDEASKLIKNVARLKKEKFKRKC